jgi:hypothetical protein
MELQVGVMIRDLENSGMTRDMCLKQCMFNVSDPTGGAGFAVRLQKPELFTA